MTLLEKIQLAAVNADTSAASMLRMCLVLSAKLGHEPLKQWVGFELDGYPENVDLPDYRIMHDVPSKGNLFGIGGLWMSNQLLPTLNLPEKHYEIFTKAEFRSNIAYYEDLLTSGEKNRSGILKSPWPANFLATVSGEFYQNMRCVDAWQEIPRGAFVSLVDTVRNRVLGFVLEIEKQSPSAGEGLRNEQLLSEDQISQAFHTHIRKMHG